MAQDRHDRISTIFTAACKLPSEDRGAYLERAAGDDSSLRDEVEALLKLDDDSEGLLQTPALGAGFCVDDARLTGADDGASLVGQTVGQYHLTRLIAAGGMGMVYEAEREAPEGQAAIKILRHSLVSQKTRRRFEYESQILARLQHPAIARIYGAGTLDGDGDLPYFAMEYIADARHITKYAEEEQLGLKERLDLFGKVCDGVQFAHQKGVIHRDLKPSNILINGSGEPKIIDFGVAKATNADVAVTTLRTSLGQLIGTLQYMSPEQCAADPHDIDFRCDVYALGVVLYELLCGKGPYDVTQAAMHQALRIIQEQAPIKPSTHRRALQGDLETIALKALEKDRERRYQSVGEFTRDIRHYLCGEPIEAKRGLPVYILGRLLRKHKAATAVAASFFLLIVAALVITLVAWRETADQTRLANAERAQALAVTNLIERMLGAADPNISLSPSYEVRQMLDDFHASFGDELKDQPEVEASVRSVMGNAYRQLGEYDKAEEQLVAALSIRRGVFGDQHDLVMESRADYAVLLRDLDKLAQSKEQMETVLEYDRRVHGESSAEVADDLRQLGSIHLLAGDHEEALATLTRALTLSRAIHGDMHMDVAECLHHLGGVYLESSDGGGIKSRYDQAMESLEEAVRIERGSPEGSKARLSDYLSSLGRALRWGGQFERAELVYREAIDISQTVFAPGHPTRAVVLNNLATLYWSQGRHEEAVPLYEETLDIFLETMGADHSYTATTKFNLASVLMELERWEEAERHFLSVLATFENGEEGDSAPFVAGSCFRLAVIRRHFGDHAAAEAYVRRVIEYDRTIWSPDDWRLVLPYRDLADDLLAQEKFVEAEEVVREILRSLEVNIRQEKWPPHELWALPEAKSMLGAALLGQEKFAEAEESVLAGYEGMSTSTDAPDDRTQRALQRLIDLYEAWNKPLQESEWRERLAKNP